MAEGLKWSEPTISPDGPRRVYTVLRSVQYGHPTCRVIMACPADRGQQDLFAWVALQPLPECEYCNFSVGRTYPEMVAMADMLAILVGECEDLASSGWLSKPPREEVDRTGK